MSFSRHLIFLKKELEPTENIWKVNLYWLILILN